MIKIGLDVVGILPVDIHDQSTI